MADMNYEITRQFAELGQRWDGVFRAEQARWEAIGHQTHPITVDLETVQRLYAEGLTAMHTATTARDHEAFVQLLGWEAQQRELWEEGWAASLRDYEEGIGF
jgi:hypothetical protein